MSTTAPVVVPCPPELRAEALALALSELAPSQRREIGGELLRAWRAGAPTADGLFVALRGEQLCGAAWGQLQPGNTAVFWPPRMDAVDQMSPLAGQLASAVVDSLDAAGVAMTQVLLPAPDAPEAPLLKTAGFHYLTDLVYLTCERERFPTQAPNSADLRFFEYDQSQRNRLVELVERTYEGTLDCVGLGVERQIEDVIDGYLATGTYRPSNWFFVRQANAANGDEADVGVLLLADHPASQHTELIYMGLVPQVRGRGWGRQIAEYAQWVARSGGAQRLVSAVDASNLPGLGVYRATHFEAWDRRSVFLRFRAQPQAESENLA